MFKQRLQLRKPDPAKLKAYDTYCLGCGRRGIAYVHPMAPLPNTTLRDDRWSRFNCMIGQHMDVPAHNVEPRSKA